MGKVKKKALNEKRGQKVPSKEGLFEINIETTIDKDILKHIQTVTGLIERRRISLEEILVMVRCILRQHSMVKGKRFVYAFQYSRGGP